MKEQYTHFKNMKIELSQFQRNNLLQFLNRVELKGIDEANALLELVTIIQQSKEENTNDKCNPQLKSQSE